MPKTKNKVTSGTTYDAVKAILFYERNSSEIHNPYGFVEAPADLKKCFTPEQPKYYTSIHDVIDDKLCAGRPISQSDILSVCQNFLPHVVKTAFLPETIIAYTPGVEMVWWVPAGDRKLYFKKSTIFKTGVVPLMPLLFRATNDSLDVWALKENKRPALETELFFPPFPNILHPGHSVCIGNVKLPATSTIDSIRAWEKVFFKSYFTGSDAVDIKVKDITWKKLWTELCGGKHKTFPVEYLVKFGQLKRLFNGGRD